MSISHQDLHDIREAEMEDISTPLAGLSQDFKSQAKDNTAAFESNEEQDFDGEWRSNVLISSTEPKQRTPYALRHLTSFEEKSMDNQGKKLSETFKQYLCWLRRLNYEPDTVLPSVSLSSLDWETVQGHILDQTILTESQKKVLISAAHRNTQAELIISQIIEQIPESYYPGALTIASALIEDFKKSSLSGSEQEQIMDYVNQIYLIQASKLHDRLLILGLTNQSTKDHEKYNNFIKTWMEVFYLSLNGYLENPIERKNPFHEMTNQYPGCCFGKKQSKFQ